MDDVIFAGTAKRAALGRAEVSLTIDNSSGLLPIEFTEVTITRTLFRSGDSEYAINGVPCRLLDVQELLSDSGMGRQQHVIISQGQIDAVLNARPEDRRLIIEEAAGVLKYRRRKEKAERRLAATEANFTRLEDLLREVRRQLRPLEKQADAARRHQGIADELHALKVHLAGRDLIRLRTRLADNETQSAKLQGDERATRAALAELDTKVMAAEAAIIAHSGSDLAAHIGQCESLREKGRGQRALIAERRRRIELQRTALMDQGVVASLTGEAADLDVELHEVDAKIASTQPDLDDVVNAMAQLDVELARIDAGPASENYAQNAAKLRGEIGALDAAAERTKAELDRLHARRANFTERLDRLRSELDDLEARVNDAADIESELQAAFDQALVDVAANESHLLDAQAQHREAQAQHAAWVARVETLESALDAARAKAGVERLKHLAGVIGTLLDVVEVDDGFASAFEAGAGEAIAAVVLEDVTGAKLALEQLRSGGFDGAVLALGQRSAGSSREVPSLPGTSALRDRVRSDQSGVSSLLDLLVQHVVVADSFAIALETALHHPQVVVVTKDGDRFGPTGWRVTATTGGANAGALELARSSEAETAQVATAAADQAELAQTALVRANEDLSVAQRTLTQAAERAATDRVRFERTTSDHADAMSELDALENLIVQIENGPGLDLERRGTMVDEVARLEELQVESERANHDRDLAKRSVQEKQADLGSRRSEMQMRLAGLRERRGVLATRAAEIDERLTRDHQERAVADEQQAEHNRTFKVLSALDTIVAQRLGELDAVLVELKKKRQEQNDQERERNQALEALRTQRTAREAELETQRDEIQKLGLVAAEVRVRAEQVVAMVRSELDVDPEQAIAAPCPPIDGEMSPVARVRDLERELRAMGTINPLALAEFEAMSERHEFLGAQLDDVKGSRRELVKVIREVDNEIAATFASAYADVRENFVALFTMLFPGGTGDLSLTDPDDPLNTGIEIKAKPSGKNVRKLSLLSGGERSLVALAYLFAVFRSRSSPFYVMDEVEAALDDVNLHRFLDLVAEFRSQAQLIIVSHQKRTMEAADTLYGVTMQPGGSSKVISEKV